MTGNSNPPDPNGPDASAGAEGVAQVDNLRKKKPYEIRLNPYFEYGKRQTGWWTKGHHPHFDLINALKESGHSVLEDSIQEERHEFWRAMPYGGGYVFVPSSGSSLGDFPVTIIEGSVPPPMPDTIDSSFTKINKNYFNAIKKLE